MKTKLTISNNKAYHYHKHVFIQIANKNKVIDKK
jgi:hypothetical protein